MGSTSTVNNFFKELAVWWNLKQAFIEVSGSNSSNDYRTSVIKEEKETILVGTHWRFSLITTLTAGEGADVGKTSTKEKWIRYDGIVEWCGFCVSGFMSSIAFQQAAGSLHETESVDARTRTLATT